MECPVRKYPLRRPDGHKPPIPRWWARFPEAVDKVFTAYIGVQQHNAPNPGFEKCLSRIEDWLSNTTHGPASVERFRVIDGHDAPQSLVFVCYWDDETKYDDAIQQLNLTGLYRGLDALYQQTLGLWCERFTSQVSRLETNYTGTDYLPGLAQLPDTGTQGHSYTGYWGAARDRIPDSAHDLFEKDHDSHSKTLPSTPPSSLGKRLVSTNAHNLTHIRSGQFWKTCGEDERRSYEEKLEPTLREGLAYLWQNPLDTGSMALRYLKNVPSSSPQWAGESDESCVIGFFRSLGELESWAKRHPSHLAIYTGAIRHAKTFGDTRKFRTWHEVSVLNRGDAQFEYINCLSETGMIKSGSLVEVAF